jgi:hypothetical protein
MRPAAIREQTPVLEPTRFMRAPQSAAIASGMKVTLNSQVQAFHHKVLEEVVGPLAR